MRKLVDILLRTPERGTISLPPGESVLDSLMSNPQVRLRLGGVDSMTLSVQPGSVLATAAGQPYQLKKGMVVRLVYDDSSIDEWRIADVQREHSGSKPMQVECEHISQDLRRHTVRQTLTTGKVRVSIGFYNMTLQQIAENLLSAEYNGPSLFRLGSVAPSLNAKEFNLVLNGATLMNALKEASLLAEAEWGVRYDAGTDRYLVDFYEQDMLGGGIAQAGDRPIGIGGDLGNRVSLERRNERQEDFSRVVPLSGSDNEIKSIGGIVWRVASQTSIGGNRVLTMEDPMIVKDGYGTVKGQSVYFAGRKVVSTQRPNRITVEGSSAAPSSGKFTLGGTSVDLAFIEDPEAVENVGIVEKPYSRPDITPYGNLASGADVSADLSRWEGGMPVGFSRIAGTETVNREFASLFVRHGSSSARVRTGIDGGLQTDYISISPSSDDPYFSAVAYIQVISGRVKFDLIQANGEIHPENELAETNINEIRSIHIAGLKLTGNSIRLRVTAMEENTEFILDAVTLTQSSTAWEYAPNMGPKSLWIEGSKYLARYGGATPSTWTAQVYDEAYFGSAREIEIGSWVTVKEDFDGSTYHTQTVLRVIEIEYHEDTENGRYSKRLRLGERGSSLSRPFLDEFLSKDSLQGSLDIRDTMNNYPGIEIGRHSVRIFSQLNGVGVLTQDVSGNVTSLPVNLYTQVREGQTFGIILETRDTPIYVTLSRPEGYEGEDLYIYDSGVQPLPIHPQLVEAPAGAVLTLSGTQLQSYLHVDPGGVYAKTMRDTRGDSIGVLSADLSETITSVPLKEIHADTQLRDGQELRIINKEGRNERLIVDGDQDLTAPTGSIVVQEKTLSYEYIADHSFVRQPSYNITGELNITQGRTEILQQVTSDQGSAIAGITLDVSQMNTAIINIEAKVDDNEGAIAQAYIDLESYADGQVASAKIDIMADVSNDIGSAVSGLAAQSYVDEEISQASASLMSSATQYVDGEIDDLTGEMQQSINSAVSGLATSAYVNNEIASAELRLENKVETDIGSAVSGLASESYVNGQVGSASTNILNQVSNNIVPNAVSGLASESYVDSEVSSATASLYTQIGEHFVGIQIFNSFEDDVYNGKITITGDTVFSNDVEIRGDLVVTKVIERMEVQGEISDTNRNYVIDSQGIKIRSGDNNIRRIRWVNGVIGSSDNSNQTLDISSYQTGNQKIGVIRVQAVGSGANNSILHLTATNVQVNGHIIARGGIRLWSRTASQLMGMTSLELYPPGTIVWNSTRARIQFRAGDGNWWHAQGTNAI